MPEGTGSRAIGLPSRIACAILAGVHANSLLRAAATLPEGDVREALRQAVEHGVLVADLATGSFRFRHALLAEAIYTTILPGEREELHARLADALARDGAPPAGRRSRWRVNSSTPTMTPTAC
jgi:predicted ATPase